MIGKNLYFQLIWKLIYDSKTPTPYGLVLIRIGITVKQTSGMLLKKPYHSWSGKVIIRNMIKFWQDHWLNNKILADYATHYYDDSVTVSFFLVNKSCNFEALVKFLPIDLVMEIICFPITKK